MHQCSCLPLLNLCLFVFSSQKSQALKLFIYFFLSVSVRCRCHERRPINSFQTYHLQTHEMENMIKNCPFNSLLTRTQESYLFIVWSVPLVCMFVKVWHVISPRIIFNNMILCVCVCVYAYVIK